MNVREAAKLLNVSPQFIRIGLQTQRLPIGTAVKMSSKWTYHISEKLLNEYIDGGGIYGQSVSTSGGSTEANERT